MKTRPFNPIKFTRSRDGETKTFALTGRDAWALSRLIAAGAKGVSPIDEPTGPRWSAYIFNLRQIGLDIETRHEAHGGAFPGTHARYVLRSDVRRAAKGAE